MPELDMRLSVGAEMVEPNPVFAYALVFLYAWVTITATYQFYQWIGTILSYVKRMISSLGMGLLFFLDQVRLRLRKTEKVSVDIHTLNEKRPLMCTRPLGGPCFTRNAKSSELSDHAHRIQLKEHVARVADFLIKLLATLIREDYAEILLKSALEKKQDDTNRYASRELIKQMIEVAHLQQERGLLVKAILQKENSF